MATVLEIIQANTDDIRNKTLPGSITRGEDADLRDQVARELRDRGVLRAETTGDMASISADNTKLVVVKDVGVFWALVTGASPDGLTTFASADAGTLWEKIIAVTLTGAEPEIISVTGNHEYELSNGFMIDKIMVKPTVANTLKIGFTDGSEEILFATLLTVGQWNIVNYDIVAAGGDVSIFFNGLSVSAQIIIYKRSLPLT